jgi:two-component system, NarL family, invasion response regulator UvrY
MYQFLIVDDHCIFRQGVINIITKNLEQAFFGEASNSIEALVKVFDHSWDLVILDLDMPGRSGLDAIHDIHLVKPLLPVLVLSMHDESQMALRAIKAGARGYLTKGKAVNDLISAINKILEGKQYISETVAELLGDEYRNTKNKDLIKNLSDREYYVLLRLTAGQSVTEISKILMLSVKTISTYRTRIMRKLNLKNMVELIQFMKDKNS